MTDDTPQGEPLVELGASTVDYTYGGRFRMLRTRYRFRRFDGTMSEPVTRICFERGDSVGVLLYDPAADAVVLVRQFRYPVYESLGEAAHGPGARAAWILEIVAGVLDRGETVADVANRELLEEAGYRIAGDLEPVAAAYASPGGTSERIHIFLGRVDHTTPAGAGGGVAAEGEDIQVVALPLADALAAIADGRIADAKTIIALQHLALRKAGRG